MPLSSKTFETYFEKFSTTTVIRVFNFIRISAFRVERIFWILVLVGFTSTTAWSVTRTVNTFLSEPTASQVSFGSNVSTGLTFPNAILCLQLRSDNLQSVHSPKVVNVVHYIKTANDLEGSLTAKIDKIHASEQLRADSLLKELALLVNSTNLVKATEQLLNDYHKLDERSNDAFSENEVALLGLTNSMFVYLTSLEMHPMLHAQAADWPSRRPSQKLHQEYVAKGTNFSQLFDLMAEMLCVRLQIRMVTCHLSLHDESIECTPYNFCRLFSSPVYFGRDAKKEAICYPLGGNDDPPLSFRTPYDTVTITIHAESLYKSDIDLRQNTFHFNGNLAVEDPPLFFNKRQIAEFNLETISTLVDLRRRGCFDRGTRPGTSTTCQSWCRVESIVSACKCMPLTRQVLPSYAKLPDGIQSCALKAFANVDKNCRLALSQYDGDYANCSQQCYDQDCEKFFFINNVQAGYDPTTSTLNASTAVVLMSTKFVYQKVDEYLTMDLIALIGSLGGNFSLYLGASFLALIHIVVFFVKLPFEAAERKEAPKSAKVVAITPAASRWQGTTTNEHLEALVKILVDDISRMRRDLRALNTRQDLTDLDRKLVRAALQQLRANGLLR